METYFFGNTRDGETVTAYRLENSRGTAAVILDYGCIIHSLFVPNAQGGLTDVVLGYDSISEYEENDGYLGAVIGRVAGRLAGAELILNGETRQLAKNDGENQLHGGIRGFDRYVWKAEQEGIAALVLSRLSPDGEENYPGNLLTRVRYELTEDCELKISYEAKTDADTVVSLTNHSYFNLRGGNSALGHFLQLHADRFAETNNESLTTGRLLPVEGTVFDFRAPKEIGRDLGMDDEQLRLVSGYDHTFALAEGAGLKKAASLFCPETGIRMCTFTTLPSVQLYIANHLSPRKGKNGAQYDRRHAVCLETQFFPNALKNPSFPSPILRKGETHRSETVYRFELADRP